MPAVKIKPKRRSAQHPAKVATVAVGVACACYHGPTAFALTAPPRGLTATDIKAAYVVESASFGGANATTSQTAAPSAAAVGGALVSATIVASVACRGLAARRTTSTKQRTTTLEAFPDGADFLEHLQGWTNTGGIDELLQHLRHPPPSSFELVPPAFAAEAAALDLDPGTKYLYGADGAVLMDPMNNKPLVDDWWNGFVGLQKNALLSIDATLRKAGLPQSFGWTIVLYVSLINALFYPFQPGQQRTAALMLLLKPQVKEIEENCKGDTDAQSQMLQQLYNKLDVNPLGGCLPIFLQLPIFWSLFGVWRRLYSEQYPYFSERFLWVPHLSQPNPDFQLKLDWLFDFENGRPIMGWEDYLCYLIFPAILITSTALDGLEPTASSDGKDDQSLQSKFPALFSVCLTGWISLEFPQAIAVYYTTNKFMVKLVAQLAKDSLRHEIPGYEEYQKTGKFPEGALQELMYASEPPPKSLHEAAMRGDKSGLAKLCEEGTYDLNAFDENERSPIGYAVACGHLAVVRDLLARGVKIDVLDGQDNTLLHYAAWYGRLETVQELLELGKGTWPNDEWREIKNHKGQTAYDCARLNNKTTVMEFLRERLGLPPAAEEPSVDSTAAAADLLTKELDAKAAKAAKLKELLEQWKGMLVDVKAREALEKLPRDVVAQIVEAADLLTTAGGSEAATVAVPSTAEVEISKEELDAKAAKLKELLEQWKRMLVEVKAKEALEKQIEKLSPEEISSMEPAIFQHKLAPGGEPPASTPQTAKARSVD